MAKRSLAIVIAALALSTGCGRSDKESEADKKEEPSLEEEARKKASGLRDRAAKLRDKASALEDTASDLKDEAAHMKDRAARFKDKMSSYADRAADAGKDAVSVIRPYAENGKGHIENTIVEGKQNLIKAGQMAVTVAPAIADGIGFRPIYLELDGKDDRKKIDRAIGNMPRVEVIDGLTVGFRAFTKRQFLVVWRQDARLIGFVYTSLIDVAIEHLVEQAPRIIGLVSKLS